MASQTSKEETFRAYSDAQGAVYARGRPGYRQDLYDIILDYHTATGGKKGVHLDIGCGAGKSTRELGRNFDHVIGLDPSPGLIAAARAASSGFEKPIRFEVSTDAELGSNLSPPVADGSVDLVTAATAAQYFDMPAFWSAAARVLKPGGAVALWRGSFLHIHPSTPNHVRVGEELERFISEIEKYKNESSTSGGVVFETLPLPWTLTEPVAEFDEGSFVRKVWNEGGEVALDEEYFLNHQKLSLEGFEDYLATVSSTARWREAHPDDVGTERDVVRSFSRKVEALLREAGAEKGREAITAGMSGVLLMVKKRM